MREGGLGGDGAGSFRLTAPAIVDGCAHPLSVGYPKARRTGGVCQASIEAECLSVLHSGLPERMRRV